MTSLRFPGRSRGWATFPLLFPTPDISWTLLPTKGIRMDGESKDWTDSVLPLCRRNGRDVCPRDFDLVRTKFLLDPARGGSKYSLLLDRSRDATGS